MRGFFRDREYVRDGITYDISELVVTAVELQRRKLCQPATSQIANGNEEVAPVEVVPLVGPDPAPAERFPRVARPRFLRRDLLCRHPVARTPGL